MRNIIDHLNDPGPGLYIYLMILSKKKISGFRTSFCKDEYFVQLREFFPICSVFGKLSHMYEALRTLAQEENIPHPRLTCQIHSFVS